MKKSIFNRLMALSTSLLVLAVYLNFFHKENNDMRTLPQVAQTHFKPAPQYTFRNTAPSHTAPAR